MHRNWRDCAAWQDYGLPMSTTSNEACKLFDATLTQLTAWEEGDSVGGLQEGMAKMFQADENFVMGRVLVNGMQMMSSSNNVRRNEEFAHTISQMETLAEKDHVLLRERKHVLALKSWANDRLDEALQTWEDILVEFPCDMLAIKFSQLGYLSRGYREQMRDSIARVLPHWTKKMPHYGYLLGMYALGLVETNLFKQAENVAKRGLLINKDDAWSAHSLAHVYEMEGRFREGQAFLKSTEANWSHMAILSCHLYWHWALYHLEEGNYDDVLHLFDTEIKKRVNSGGLFQVSDASSLLFRLQLEGIDVVNRWDGLYEKCEPYKNDHMLVFNDAHIVMSCLGGKNDEAATEVLESMKKFARKCVGDNAALTREVGIALCESLVAYANDDFEKAVDLIVPIRYKIILLGGSEAQLDVFKLYLIIAAMKSKRKEHILLSRQLSYERKALRDNSPLTDRLLVKALMLDCN